MTVEIVADSGCGFNPGDPEVQKLGIHILPLHTNFIIDGQTVPFADGQLTPAEFLVLMAKSKGLPKTEGSVQGPALALYPQLAEQTQQIISIHVSSDYSAAYSSAVTAAEQVMSKKPGLTIGVINSKRISLPMYFLLELAAGLASQGSPLPEIQEKVITSIPKTGVVIGLKTIDNLVKGGRAPGIFKSALTIANMHSILEMSGDSGKLQRAGFVQGLSHIPQRLTDDVALACEKPGIAKLAVIHTGAPAMAQDLAGLLQEIYPGEILIKDITGSAVSIHSGQDAVGVAFMTN